MRDLIPNVQTREGQERLRELGIVVLPQPDELTAPYWEAALRHQLAIQYCGSCGSYQHPPALTCRSCDDTQLRWRTISGRGRVYSFIVVHRLLIPGFHEPYVVAQIQPEECESNLVRITANIKGCDVHEVYIGMPVEVFFEDLALDVSLPQFRPAKSGIS